MHKNSSKQFFKTFYKFFNFKKNNKEKKEESGNKTPMPINDINIPVIEMTGDMLPPPLREWALDVSHRMQSPLDYIAVTSIVILSSIVGTACTIRPKEQDDWAIVPNLWGATIGRPSVTLKSPSMKEAMRFLEKLQDIAKDAYKKERAVFKNKNNSTEQRQKEIEKKIKVLKLEPECNQQHISKLETELLDVLENTEPTLRIYKTNESTIQSQTELQKSNLRGVLTFRDELTGLLTKWNRSDSEEERAYFLEGWNGNSSYTDYKIGRGLTDAPNICISILGGIQPDKLSIYIEKTFKGGNDGLLQRFQLAVYPEEPENWEFVDIKPNTEEKKRVFSIFKLLADVDFCDIGAQTENDNFSFLRFNDKAQILFNDWYTNLHKIRIKNEENTFIAEHISKYSSLMPSLALIFYLLEIADKKGKLSSVSENATRLAIKWCDYLESHARKIYTMTDLQSKNISKAKKLTEKILSGELKTGFTHRDIYRHEWEHLTKTEEIKKACSVLEIANWISVIKTPSKKGRPTKKYEINSLVFKNK